MHLYIICPSDYVIVTTVCMYVSAGINQIPALTYIQCIHFSRAVISINGIEDEVTSYITWYTVLHECQIAAYCSCVVWH